MENELITENKTTKWKVNKVGLVVSGFIIFAGFAGIVEEYKRDPLDQNTKNRIVFGAPDGHVGLLSLLTDTSKQKYYDHAEAIYTMQEMETYIPMLVVGICLLIRSFIPGFGVVQITLTILGGFLIGLVFSPVIGVMIRVGVPQNFGAIAGICLLSIPGALLVQHGLRPQKGFLPKQSS